MNSELWRYYFGGSHPCIPAIVLLWNRPEDYSVREIEQDQEKGANDKCFQYMYKGVSALQSGFNSH